MALIVAVDHYADPGLGSLNAPAADAAALEEVLADPDLGGFVVRVLHNATSSAVREQVDRLLTGRATDDLVMLYFSGHGVTDDEGELHLAAINTELRYLPSTAVEAAWIGRRMRRSRAGRIVLFLDCCFGGAFERGMIHRSDGSVNVLGQFGDRFDEGRGRAIITASTATQYAFEDATITGSDPPKPSLFTDALVEGLRSGDADRDQDGQVSLNDLYDHVFEQVRMRSPHQTPSKWELGTQGGFYLARNPNRRVVPGRLPGPLLDLIAHDYPYSRQGAVAGLEELAGGLDLPLAAAARLALHDLTSDDSKRVSELAHAALTRTTLTVDATEVHFGRVPVGPTPLRRTIAVSGPPLAAAASATSTSGHIRVRLSHGRLEVTWIAREAGPLDAYVTVGIAADDIPVHVTGEAVTATPKPPPAAPRSPRLWPNRPPLGQPPAPRPAPTPIDRETLKAVAQQHWHELVPCPVCGSKVRGENLVRHVDRKH